MPGNITSADAVYMLGIPGVFNSPQQLQGFSTEDIFDTEAVDAAQLMMGVDGFLSGGFIFVEFKQTVSLQGDSDSNALFDTWYAAQVAAKQLFPANGTIQLPAIGRSAALTRGFLTSYTPLPDAKKVLQPRKFGITWNKIEPAAI
jgi:hypothetical protein